jgi:hypothetical protein
MLRETESEIGLSQIMEPCPFCGSLLSESLQKRPVISKTEKPVIFQHASWIPRLTIDIEKMDFTLSFLGMLEDRKVPVEELSFTTRASKNVDEYRVNSVQKDAMIQLKEEGESVKAGQKIQYIITDYSRKTKRSIPLKMTQQV